MTKVHTSIVPSIHRPVKCFGGFFYFIAKYFICYWNLCKTPPMYELELFGYECITLRKRILHWIVSHLL
jgi:hypothetical protein